MGLQRAPLSELLLYRTAVVARSLEMALPHEPRFAWVVAGRTVVVQFAWRTCGGDAVFYFGASRGDWLGVSIAGGFSGFRA